MSNVEKYDVVSNIWLPVAPMHMVRAGPAVSEFHGKIWVAGGLIGDKATATNAYITNAIATNSVEYYNSQHNT